MTLETIFPFIVGSLSLLMGAGLLVFRRQAVRWSQSKGSRGFFNLREVTLNVIAAAAVGVAMITIGFSRLAAQSSGGWSSSAGAFPGMPWVIGLVGVVMVVVAILSIRNRRQHAAIAAGHVHRVDAPAAAEMLETASTNDALIVGLDGASLRTVDDVVRVYAREFSFPVVAGDAWNSFTSHMRTLDNAQASAYLTVIDNADGLLVDEAAELPKLLREFDEIGRAWARKAGGVSFQTVLVGAG